MKNDLCIREVENGYITERKEDDKAGRSELVESVFQVHEEDPDSLTAFQEMLYEIILYFRMIGSKHDSRRLRVEIIDQHKEQ
jgi:hypothetical protein